jgi:hypothetical protein
MIDGLTVDRDIDTFNFFNDEYEGPNSVCDTLAARTNQKPANVDGLLIRNISAEACS